MQAQTMTSLRDAAAPLAALLAKDEAPQDLGGLLDHIVTRYHHTHLRELPVAIDLAEQVEHRYPTRPDCPTGLADHLKVLAKDLEAHQWREEATLFPMIRIGAGHCLNFATRRMMDDHVAMDVQVMALQRFNAVLQPSPADPLCWQALAFMCRKLEADLREHARLEHVVLYALLLG